MAEDGMGSSGAGDIDLFRAIGSDQKPTKASIERARDEEQAFDGTFSDDAYRKTKEKYDGDRWAAHIEDLRQTRDLKEKFARYVLKYLAIFSFTCLAILILEGINPKFDFSIRCGGQNLLRARMGQFHLDDGPLTTLIGSTAVSAIGLVAIVLRGLFRSPADENKIEDDKKSEEKS